MLAAGELKLLLNQIAVQNDGLAYKKLFLAYHPRLVRFASSIIHSREWAEEVVSDVFMKIWSGRHLLANIRNFHLYIYISTKNLSINRLLKEKKHHIYSLDEVQVTLDSFQPDPEQIMINSEMNHRVQKAIQMLPPKCKLIFRLIREDGFSYRETAELLELSVKTVENQMTIALKKIGESIRPHFMHAKLN